MHRCWDVAELTQTIFQMLEPVYPKSGTDRRITTQGQLYRLALTCRKFRDPALDGLWESPSFIDLLKCLPSHVWESSERSFVRRLSSAWNVIMTFNYQKIRSPVGPGDWERVLTYSKRIRRFHAESDPSCFDASVLQSLVNSLPSGPLIPNLRSLDCRSWSKLFPHLSRLVGKHVLKIYVEIDGPAADLLPIARHCRLLRHVKFNGPSDDSTRDWVSAFLIQLTHLQSVEVFYMTQDAFLHVAGLDHVEILRVRCLDMEAFAEVDRPYILFPALHQLALGAESVTFPTHFVKVLDRAPLETIGVTSRQDCTAINSRALFWAIHTYCFTSRNTLTSITVELTEDFDTLSVNTSPYTMPSRVIRPLLGFPNLRHVNLSSPVGFILDNEFVDDMARAWPCLDRLSIKGQHTRRFPSTSNPTIMALQSFSRHCPHLRHLSLLVDATNIQMDHSSRTPRTIHTTLESWNPLYSSIDSPVEVAIFLSSLFPSLSKIRAPINKLQWKEVETLVPVYAKIRADERLFAQAP
ncbi:hypothetical protein GGX14DRAFT_697938 [Mycena pura]|uniref:F-box domain-containing protein n=1 Tax=Mycena pura TaxID=153505 RepID=A0AAD6VCB4_9AGAR|nr:hypothetical protein GGX14DRAFT_697938 [Mycena pura]